MASNIYSKVQITPRSFNPVVNWASVGNSMLEQIPNKLVRVIASPSAALLGFLTTSIYSADTTEYQTTVEFSPNLWKEANITGLSDSPIGVNEISLWGESILKSLKDLNFADKYRDTLKDLFSLTDQNAQQRANSDFLFLADNMTLLLYIAYIIEQHLKTDPERKLVNLGNLQFGLKINVDMTGQLEDLIRKSQTEKLLDIVSIIGIMGIEKSKWPPALSIASGGVQNSSRIGIGLKIYPRTGQGSTQANIEKINTHTDWLEKNLNKNDPRSLLSQLLKWMRYGAYALAGVTLVAVTAVVLRITR